MTITTWYVYIEAFNPKRISQLIGLLSTCNLRSCLVTSCGGRSSVAQRVIARLCLLLFLLLLLLLLCLLSVGELCPRRRVLTHTGQTWDLHHLQSDYTCNSTLCFRFQRPSQQGPSLGVSVKKNSRFFSRQMFFFVFLKVKGGLFSCIFRINHSFLCKFELLSFNGD